MEETILKRRQLQTHRTDKLTSSFERLKEEVEKEVDTVDWSFELTRLSNKYRESDIERTRTSGRKKRCHRWCYGIIYKQFIYFFLLVNRSLYIFSV